MVRNVARDKATLSHAAEIGADQHMPPRSSRLPIQSRWRFPDRRRQGWGIVDTVADHRHHFSLALQTFTNRGLLRRRTPAETSSIPTCRATASTVAVVSRDERTRKPSDLSCETLSWL